MHLLVSYSLTTIIIPFDAERLVIPSQGATGMKKNDIGSIKKFRALALDLPTST